MSPMSFLRNPAIWLQAIDKFRAAVTGCPPFALDILASAKVAPMPPLDLSCLRWMVIGAEPIRHQTLSAFADRFVGKHKLNIKCLSPAYGLAEASLMVSLKIGGSSEPLWVSPDSFAPVKATSSDAVAFVSCGVPVQEIRIDPQTRELFIRGPSVARGYWGKESVLVKGDWMPSGDAAFLHEGELYICGRLKDVIVIRGRKIWPQDIEFTVETDSDPNVRRGCVAALSVKNAKGVEGLGIAVEHRHYSALTSNQAAECRAMIASSVARQHGVRPHVLLVAPRSLAKTSSGKMQRWKARELFEKLTANREETERVTAEMQLAFPFFWSILIRLAGWMLRLSRLWRRAVIVQPAPAPVEPKALPVAVLENGNEKDKEQLVTDQIVSAIASRLGCSESLINVNAPLLTLGLDSKDLVSLAEELPGGQVSPALLFDYPTIAALAMYLSGKTNDSAAVLSVSVSRSDSSVALCGIGLRLAGKIDSPEAFWTALCGKRDLIGPPPKLRQELRGAGLGGWLDNVASYDASQFSMSQDEAAACDPAQRLLLTVAHEAIVDADLGVLQAASKTGVWVGCASTSGYSEVVAKVNPDRFSATGLALSMTANRLSSYFGFEGPSLTIDTACSSSLVAVHSARESIAKGECLDALVGGLNLCLSSKITTALHRGGFLSPSSRCRSYSALADGYVRGEGAVVVVLSGRPQVKSYAVLKGSAVSHSGRTMTLTAPKSSAQERVIREALQCAHLDAANVDFIEGHGSATPLGDQVELEALHRVFGDRDSNLIVSSVKCNFGHLEAAAGLVGLLKVAMSLHRQGVPPVIHFQRDNANPAVRSPICVPVEFESLRDNGSLPLVGGVSSFGFGGTNAHAVLMESPFPKSPKTWPARGGKNQQDCWIQPVHVMVASQEPTTLIDASIMKRMTELCRRQMLAALKEPMLPQFELLRKRFEFWIHSSEGDKEMDTADNLEELRSEFPEWSAELDMLSICSSSLSQVLSGELLPLEVLFPAGDASNAERVFSHSPLSIGANRAAGRAVSSLFEQHRARGSDGAPFVVLEVGAGTGGTTSHILAALSDLKPGPGELRYIFTDVSSVFLSLAGSKFQSYDFLEFRTFNLEENASEPVWQAHVVVAANVVHATRSVDDSLAQLRKCASVALVLVEITTPIAWLDLTFGLTDQWWNFTNDWRREDNLTPLLSTDQWVDALIDASFDLVNVAWSHSVQSVLIGTLFGQQQASSVTTKDRLLSSQPPQSALHLDETLVAAVENAPNHFERAPRMKELVRQAIRQAMFPGPEEDVGDDESLVELGMDSMTALQLKSAVDAKFRIRLPISSLMAEPTISTVTIAALDALKERSTLAPVVRQISQAIDHYRGNAYIFAFGSAKPAYAMNQRELMEDAAIFYQGQSDEVLGRLTRVYSGSEIETRYSVLPDWLRGTSDADMALWNGWRQGNCTRNPGVGDRNAIYSREAPLLALAAAEKALKAWGGSRSDITHVVSVSCTGTLVPGIEFRLVEGLKLSFNVERLAVNFMGCFGGIAGLRTARALAESAGPRARVLLVCTELCTLHFEGGSTEPLSGESIVASALFADGSAAAIVGCAPRNDGSESLPIWSMEKQRVQGIPASEQCMTWDLGDHGWKVGLAAEIPVHLADAAVPFVDALLDGIPRADVEFALHPGGPSIVRGIETMLGLGKWQTKTSWDVLKNHGNMSSCTVLHCLERAALEEKAAASCTVAMAFGPGLSIEGIRLHRAQLHTTQSVEQREEEIPSEGALE